MAKKKIVYSPRMATIQIAFLASVIVLIAWDLSLIFGIPGFFAALPILLRARKSGLTREHRLAWIGFYGAVAGTVCSLAIHLLMGEFTNEALMATMKKSPELWQGVESNAANLRDIWKLMPVYCLLGNSFGGAIGGLLAERISRRREERGD